MIPRVARAVRLIYKEQQQAHTVRESIYPYRASRKCVTVLTVFWLQANSTYFSNCLYIKIFPHCHRPSAHHLAHLLLTYLFLLTFFAFASFWVNFNNCYLFNCLFRNMVRNSICRMTMHGRWWINDPDCILLRESTNYSEAEMIGIATLKAMSGK